MFLGIFLEALVVTLYFFPRDAFSPDLDIPPLTLNEVEVVNVLEKLPGP